MNRNPRLYGRLAGGVAALVLVLVLAVAALRRPESAEVPIAAVTRADLLVPILSDGILEPPPQGELRAPESATVAAIRVREGERVRRGTVLLELENPSLAAKARDARSEASALGAERAKASADLESDEAEAARLRRTLESDERLLAQGAITRAAYEADDLALRSAGERVRAARARRDSLAGAGGPSRVGLSEESAKELARRVESLIVRSPADGIVYGLPRRVGETVDAGQVVGAVTDPDHLRVRIRVDQPDLPRVRPGQKIVVTFDGLPDRRWMGTVTLVAPGLRDVGGRQVGEVLAEIADPTSQIPPNASVNVQIVVAEKKGALVVPRAALLADGDRRFVYVEEKGRAIRRDVEVGLIGLTEVEIASGLKEGERVILAGAVPLSEGMRVKPRKK